MPMAEHKKILLRLPEFMVEEVDALAKQNGVSRTEILRIAVAAYISGEKKAQLKKGYAEMGKLNLSLAEMCFEADTAVLKSCEEKLAESE